MLAKIENIISEIKIEYEENNALYTGNAGLFLFELLANRLDENNSEIANQIVGTRYDSPSMCNGKAGVNWLFTMLFKEYGIVKKKIIKQIRQDDEYLKQLSIEYILKGNYDFMHGALGISYYLLYDKDTIDKDYHEKILKLLDEQYTSLGVFNYESFFDINPQIKKISLGLSHGLPSILRYLAECFKHNINSDLTKSLAYKLINEIKTYQNKDINNGYFPTMIHIGEERKDSYSRLAWCYGDPGVGIVLYHVGKIFKDKDLENFGKQILLDTTKRKTTQETLIGDAGICHGAAGLIHIYNRMWLSTEDIRFKKATEYWINQLEPFTHKENNQLEYKKFNRVENSWEPASSLLEGSAGVGLVLNSYITSDLSWDYCLMLND